jgi:hypothetical protein
MSSGHVRENTSAAASGRLTAVTPKMMAGMATLSGATRSLQDLESGVVTTASVVTVPTFLTRHIEERGDRAHSRSPRSPGISRPWLNVLVQAEEVGRVVARLELDQSIVVLPVSTPSSLVTFLA